MSSKNLDPARLAWKAYSRQHRLTRHGASAADAEHLDRYARRVFASAQLGGLSGICATFDALRDAISECSVAFARLANQERARQLEVWRWFR